MYCCNIFSNFFLEEEKNENEGPKQELVTDSVDKTSTAIHNEKYEEQDKYISQLTKQKSELAQKLEEKGLCIVIYIAYSNLFDQINKLIS